MPPIQSGIKNSCAKYNPAITRKTKSNFLFMTDNGVIMVDDFLEIF
jgi:hypothetical protein